MIERQVLLSYLSTLLQPERYQDYAPNGLQVEGRAEISRIVTGVTACQALLDRAVELRADLILVHHGYFWKGEAPCLLGMKRRRIKTLLDHDLNLVAYHLPLDGHAEFGNNVQLAKQLGILIEAEIDSPSGAGVVLRGRLPEAMTPLDFSNHIEKKMNRSPLVLLGGDHSIQTLAWCTGAAADYIDLAAAAHVDAFLTGELSERTTHSARELALHCFGAGHHATEQYGVQALGEHLAERFSLDVKFVDIPNPV